MWPEQRAEGQRGSGEGGEGPDHRPGLGSYSEGGESPGGPRAQEERLTGALWSQRGGRTAGWGRGWQWRDPGGGPRTGSGER